MNEVLESIFTRGAVKVFEPVQISEGMREQILDAARHAPSSFNAQPYRLYWIATAKERAAAAKLCMGQMPAATASALVVVVADIGSLAATSQSQLGGCAVGVSSAKRQFTTTSGQQRSAGSSSCPGRSVSLVR